VKKSLKIVIADWINETQESNDTLDMWISDSLARSMANAAWAVLQESKRTQQWLKREKIEL